MQNKTLAAIFFIFFFTLLAFDAYARPEQMLLAYQNTTNYPFQTGHGDVINMQKPGIAVELIMLAASKLDLKVKLMRVPWKRGLHMLQHGKIDGLFNASFKPERLQYGLYPLKDGRIDPSRKSYSNTYVLYKHKGSPVTWNGKILFNLEQPIGAPLGFSIIGDLEKMGIKVEETVSTKTNFSKLARGRIDGVAALESAGDFLLALYHAEFSNIVKLHPPLKSKPYYLMLSHQFVKKNQKFSEKLWDTIAITRDSTEFKKCSLKY